MDLRSYQTDCVRNVKRDLKDHQSLGIVMPTGSGKTVVFGKIIKDYIEDNPTKKVVVVSHLSLLIEQTQQRLKKDYSIYCGVLQGSRLPMFEQVVVTTMQSLCKEEKLHSWENKLRNVVCVEKGRAGTEFTQGHLDIGLIIIDECHRIGCETYDTILNIIPTAQVLGFTATPFRENKLMSDFFEKISYTISMQELINQEHLVAPRLKLTTFDVEDLGELCGHIARIYESHRKEKGIVYFKTIQECLDARSILVSLGIDCESVTSLMGSDRRDQILEGFREDNVELLLTVDVLSAGVDFPSLRLLFMPYKVNSVTTYLQRVGRGLRPYEGKSECIIYAGNTSPGVTPGFWNKIQTTMLKQGQMVYDNYLDEFEFDKTALDKQRYRYLESIVDAYHNAKKRKMDVLAENVIDKAFPKELLGYLLKYEPYNVYGDSTCSPAQLKWARQSVPDAPDTLSKNEASAIINASKRAKGWKPQDWEVIHSGKHEGRLYGEIPKTYFHKLKKWDDVYHGWVNWCSKIGKPTNEKKSPIEYEPKIPLDKWRNWQKIKELL